MARLREERSDSTDHLGSSINMPDSPISALLRTIEVRRAGSEPTVERVGVRDRSLQWPQPPRPAALSMTSLPWWPSATQPWQTPQVHQFYREGTSLKTYPTERWAHPQERVLDKPMTLRGCQGPKRSEARVSAECLTLDPLNQKPGRNIQSGMRKGCGFPHAFRVSTCQNGSRL